MSFDMILFKLSLSNNENMYLNYTAPTKYIYMYNLK